MRISIPENSLTTASLLSDLRGHFSGVSFEQKGKRTILASKDSKTGLYIKVRKRHLFLEPDFPTAGRRNLWRFCLLLFGVIIPLTFYGLFISKRMRTFRNEIGDYLKSEQA